MSKPAASARCAASPHLNARSRTSLWESARGVGEASVCGTALGATSSHPSQSKISGSFPLKGLPPSQGRVRRALRPECPSWMPATAPCCLDEGRAALQRRNELVVPQPRVADGPATAPRHLGRFHDHQPGAAQRILAGVDEMPVGREPLDRRVLVHGRHHHPVLQPHAPDLERRKQHRLSHKRSSYSWTCLGSDAAVDRCGGPPGLLAIVQLISVARRAPLR